MAISALLLGLLLVTQCQGRRLEVNATGETRATAEQSSGPVLIIVEDGEQDAVTTVPTGASLPVLVER